MGFSKVQDRKRDSEPLACANEISSAEAIRNLNRQQVFDALRQNAPISRRELVDLVPLSRATVSSIVKEMTESGIVQEVGRAASTGGRRPILLGYRPEAKLAVGVTMFDDSIKAVLTDLEGEPVRFLERKSSGLYTEELIREMIDTVDELCGSIERRRVLGLGAGLPGVVDVDRGLIMEHISRGRSIGAPIEARQMFEESLGMPSVISNRSRAAVLGEMQHGVAKGYHNVLYLFIGRGIVASIVINGDIFFGPSFSAGELGHTTVVPEGLLCGCGNRGCLDMYSSESALVARAIAAARGLPDSIMRSMVHGGNLQLLSSDHVVKAAQLGDAAAIEALDETGRFLGIALSSAINLLNPELLILGGPIGCTTGRLLIEPVRREIERHTLSIPLSVLDIVSGSEETKSAAIGAAVLALKGAPIEAIFAPCDPECIELGI